MKTFQTILMIIGALVLSVLAFTHEEIGGYEQLVRYLGRDEYESYNGDTGDIGLVTIL